MTLIEILNILKNNFFGVNSILLGTLTLVGYLALKRGFMNSLFGAIKTIIGVQILKIGAGTLVGMAKPIFAGVAKILPGSVVPVDPYLGWTSSNTFLSKGIQAGSDYVQWVSYAVVIGFAINIILVLTKKVSNIKTIMVTGHVMFQQAAIMTAAVYVFVFGTSSASIASRGTGTIWLTGLIMGVYWAVSTNATLKACNKITNNAGFANGHQQQFAGVLAYKLGPKFGDPKDSAETKKISSKFKIFEDNLFTQVAIIMTLFTILILLIQFATPNMPKAFSTGLATSYKSWKLSGAWWGTNIILGSLKLVGSILVLTMGVRMFVTELQQAFQGVSQKIIPGSAVAVDTAALYGFAGNSVTYGFVSGVVGQFLAVAVLTAISTATGGSIPILVPLFITLFFNSGTVGAFANAGGGYRAAIIVPGIIGFIELIVAAFAIKAIGGAYEAAVAAGTALAGNSPVKLGFIGMGDWNLWWGLHFIFAGFGKIISYAVFAGSIALMLFIGIKTDNGSEKT